MSFDLTGDRAPAHPTHDGAVIGAVSRLTEEFEGALQPPVVQRVVLGSRRDLAGSPVPALPELVERLARQRLLQSVSGGRAHL